MKETKFKDTVLGKIPEDWSVAQVGDLFSMKRNNTLSRDNLNYSDLAGYKNIHYGDVLVKFGAFIDTSTDTLPFVNHDIKFNPDLLENGDVIIADTAEDETVGKASEVIGISAKDKVVSGLHTMILHPNEKFASKYLGYFLNGEAYHNSLYNSMQGTKVISISQKAINATSIAYPSLSEQQRIASALSDADALVAELDVLIEKKRAIMAGTMQEFFTGKRRLQGFDEPWVDVVFGDKIKIYRGGSPRPIESYLTNNPNGLNWIKIGDARPGDKYITKTSEKIIPEGLGATRAVYSGDFLLSNSMSFGRPYILKIDGCIHDGWLSITEYQETFDRDFLYYLLGSDAILQKFKTLAAGSGVQNLNKKLVADMELQIPSSLAEQRAIASILSDMDAEIAELEAKRDKYKEVRQGMMQQLLTGKIRLI